MLSPDGLDQTPGMKSENGNCPFDLGSLLLHWNCQQLMACSFTYKLLQNRGQGKLRSNKNENN